MAVQTKAKRPRINEKIRGAFHGALAAWYVEHARDLPWRHTQDPYAITVSELMLQQTQVSTVVPYFHRWLKLFPTWETLAVAPEQDVLKAWEGLGYYSRARNLQKLAREVRVLQGALPSAPEELVRLPGIGPYTAGAIASLAFGRQAALVDGNVMRVFARVFNWREDIAERSTQLGMWEIAKELLPPAKQCAVHNSALMELGATVCLPAKPQCLICPLKEVCRAEDPETLPIKKRQAIELKSEEIAMISQGGRWWLEPGPLRGRLAGFWRFPSWEGSTMLRKEQATRFTYGITRYRIHLQAWFASWNAAPPTSGRWFSSAELAEIPMSAAHGRLRKIAADLSSN